MAVSVERVAPPVAPPVALSVAQEGPPWLCHRMRITPNAPVSYRLQDTRRRLLPFPPSAHSARGRYLGAELPMAPHIDEPDEPLATDRQ